MLRFENLQDFIEIELVRQEGDDLPSKGDGYLTVRVSSAGFTGHSDPWVHHLAFCSFCDGLIELERHRRGEAEIESISPGELKLKIRAVDRRGHVAVEGTTGYLVRRENSAQWHVVQFGFEFDSSQLTTAAAVEWIRRNAPSVR